MSDLVLAEVGYGPYVAWWVAIPFFVLLFAWARYLTFVDKDTPKLLLPRDAINMGMLASLLVGLAAFFLLPTPLGALGGFLVVMLLSVGGYAGYRINKSSGEEFRVALLTDLLGDRGFGEKKADEGSTIGDFTFNLKAGGSVSAPDAEDPNRAGYDGLAMLLLDPLTRGADLVEFAPSGDQIASRYFVDGVPYEGTKVDKPVGAEACALIKRCFGGDVDERRKPQSGKFKMSFAGAKHEVNATTQGNSSGEAAKLEFDVAKRYRFELAELGLVADQLQTLADNRETGGLVIVAMPKGQGLTALEYALLRGHDAFVSQIVSIERHPQLDIEGVTQNRLDPNATPEEEAKLAAWVTSQLPGVLLASNPQSRETARELIRFAEPEHRVYVGLRAGDSFEALDAWRKLVGDDAQAMEKLRFVIAGRTFRRLCDETKVPYPPDEKLLKQLGLSGARVTEFYKPNTSGVIRDEKGQETPDTFCFGLGYKGRFGVYEMFDVNDEVRAAVAQNAGTQALRQLFRKQKRKYLQELSLARVAQGDTSVQEFLRVFKTEGEKKASPKPPPKPPAAPAAPAR